MTELIRLLFVSDTFILRVSINLCLSEHQFPFFTITVLDHLLKIRTIVVCTRHGTVDICAKYQNVIFLSILLAHSELPFDRLLGLVIRTVTGIYYCDIFLWTLKPVNVKINI